MHTAICSNNICKSLEDYYQKKDFKAELAAIGNIRWRHFRFVLPNGKFLKIQKQLKCSEDLKKLIARYRPIDIYYSVSCHLNPAAVTVRCKETKYSSIVLSSDIVFDIDFPPLSVYNLKRAQRNAQKVLELMKCYKLKYIAFSGNKGFHLVFADHHAYPSADPLKREQLMSKKRKALVSSLIDKGCKVDSAVSVDTRRIIRMPGTINSKTGMECKMLAAEDLYMDIRSILASVASISKIKLSHYNLFAYLPKIKAPYKMKKESQRAYETCYATYLSNSVIGIKNRYVAFVEFKNISEKKAMMRFEQLLREQGLPHMLIFKVTDGYCGVCLQSLQRKELIKLLVKSKSQNLNLFLKYKQNYLELDKTPAEHCIPAQMRRPIKILYGARESNQNYIGNGHYQFFKNLCCLNPEERLHGAHEVKLSYVIEQA